MKVRELCRGRWTTYKLGKEVECISKTNDDNEEEEGGMDSQGVDILLLRRSRAPWWSKHWSRDQGDTFEPLITHDLQFVCMHLGVPFCS